MKLVSILTILCMFTCNMLYASISKVDDNSLKLTTEQTYTYEDISNRIAVLTGERDRAQNNVNLLNSEIERLQKMLTDTGIKAKPIEVKDEATDNKGE